MIQGQDGWLNGASDTKRGWSDGPDTKDSEWWITVIDSQQPYQEVGLKKKKTVKKHATARD